MLSNDLWLALLFFSLARMTEEDGPTNTEEELAFKDAEEDAKLEAALPWELAQVCSPPRRDNKRMRV